MFSHRQAFETVCVLLCILVGPQHASARQQVSTTVLSGGFRDERASLMSVADLAVTELGILVLDGGTRQVLSLNRSGEVRGTWGRRGSGPGEFEWPLKIGRLGDSIWVVDGTLRRVTYFDEGGRVLRTTTLQSPQTGSQLNPVDPSSLLRNGLFLAVPRYSLQAGFERAVPQVPLLLVSSQGNTLDSLAWYPTAHRWWAISDPHAGGSGARLTTPNPLSVPPTFDASSDGAFVAWTTYDETRGRDEIAVTLLAVGSGMRHTWRIRYTPIVVDEALVERVVGEKVATLEDARTAFGGVTAARLRQWARSSLTYPETLPPVTSVVVDLSGKCVWLRREVGVGDWVVWEAYDKAGTQLHRLSLSAKLKVHEAKPDTLWGVLPDSLDVPRVVRITPVR